MSFAETPPTRRISERLAPCRYFPLRSRCGGTTASARSSGRIDLKYYITAAPEVNDIRLLCCGPDQRRHYISTVLRIGTGFMQMVPCSQLTNIGGNSRDPRLPIRVERLSPSTLFSPHQPDMGAPIKPVTASRGTVEGQGLFRPVATDQGAISRSNNFSVAQVQ